MNVCILSIYIYLLCGSTLRIGGPTLTNCCCIFASWLCEIFYKLQSTSTHYGVPEFIVNIKESPTSNPVGSSCYCPTSSSGKPLDRAIVVDSSEIDYSDYCSSGCWCSFLTCSLYKLCKTCSKNTDGHPGDREGIWLWIEDGCDMCYSKSVNGSIHTFVPKDNYVFTSVRETRNSRSGHMFSDYVIWEAQTPDEFSDKIEYDYKSKVVTIHLSDLVHSKKVFKKGSDDKWKDNTTIGLNSNSHTNCC